MGSTTASSSPPRRRLRFGLRTLLVVIAALAVVFGWVASAHRQRDASAALRASNPGAFLLYDYQAADSGRDLRKLELDRLDRLRRWLGVDYFASVAAVQISYPTDAELRLVARFGALRQLILRRAVDVTDEGLSHLRALGNLKMLVLPDANSVTDTGLGHLGEIASLEELSFAAGPRVTDAGIKTLQNLKRLKRLELSCQNDSAAAAVEELRCKLPDCEIRGSNADDLH